MRRTALALTVAALACGSNDATQSSDDGGADVAADMTGDMMSDAASDSANTHDAASETSVDACAPPPADPVLAIYKAVDAARVKANLRGGCGDAPVMLGGDAGTQSITNRYSPSSKGFFRAYYEQYLTSLGIKWQELAYPTAHSNGETDGHDVEAVLPGRSPDSIVVIVHYDSMGPTGSETSNPGCDDDMTGMATMMEAARLLSDACITRARTIRLVATDYEEWFSPGLEGARYYAGVIKALAEKENFFLLAAIDYEQSGWNCASDAKCAADAGGTTFDVYDCSGDANAFMSTALGDSLEALVGTLGSPLGVVRGCMAQNSDHYAMWEIGVPSVVTSEHAPFSNPHFDRNGGDTFATIDNAYHAEIARLSIAYTAKLAGVGQ
jgi:hypothetical protein